MAIATIPPQIYAFTITLVFFDLSKLSIYLSINSNLVYFHEKINTYSGSILLSSTINLRLEL